MSHDNHKRMKFSPEEDAKLTMLVAQYGTRAWNYISSQFSNRTPRQCRDRWNHYLSPTTNTMEWTPQEDTLLHELLTKYGKQWSLIATNFEGRTGVSIRNRCCKLSRQPNSDPIFKRVLVEDLTQSNIVKKLEKEITMIKANSPRKNLLPSCLSLLQMQSGEDSKKLCPLFQPLPSEIQLEEVLYPDLPHLQIQY